MEKTKSLIINCTTGKLEYVDAPDTKNDNAEDFHESALSSRRMRLASLAGMDIQKLSGSELRELVCILTEMLGLSRNGIIIPQNEFPNQ